MTTGETNEGDDGAPHPTEQIWTPCADGVADDGFIAHQGLFVAGIDGGSEDDLYPVGFLVLGHQRWTDTSRPPPRTWPGSTVGGTGICNPAAIRRCSSPASRAQS
ncbi:hypothetical protein [Streptomyces sp. SID8352]|uniref:hypothetical protein n=1 Tax=Streptomyces sp. SID8352 TaxID=2690338 RepID=UPI001F347931|nr:hypothetical protein [Streptomyces sp. SID8352]